MPVGRPPKYNSPEEMQIAIDEYFEDHKPDIMKDADGKAILTTKGTPVVDLNPPTISGLSLHLGFVNRASMYDYEKNPEFTNTIKTARSRCEEYVESGGMAGNIPPAMAIFALKNYGWTDRSEIEHSGSVISEFVKQLRQE